MRGLTFLLLIDHHRPFYKDEADDMFRYSFGHFKYCLSFIRFSSEIKIMLFVLSLGKIKSMLFLCSNSIKS